MQNWRFEVTGLDSVPQGELLNASARKITLALNKLDQCTFDIRLDNALADRIAACEGFVKAWRNGALVFFGPIITAEETGTAEGAHLSVTCQGGGWAMLKKAFANMTTTPNAGLRTAMDRAVIVKNEMTSAQAWGDYGVSLTAMPISAAETVTYTIEPFMLIEDLIRVMQSSDNGFDWRMVPLDNWDDATGTVTSTKHTAFWAAPVLGEDKPGAIWEYGAGTLANIATYRTMVSRESQMTIAVSSPNQSMYFTASADGSIINKWGSMVDVVTRDDFPDKGTPGGSPEMISLRDAHLAVRSVPRRITVWEPHLDPTGIRMPDYGIDYEVGDTVHGRGIANGEVRFDGLFRCWGVDFTLEDNGFERANLTLEETEA
jgi:hypothetical protein